MTKDEIQAKLVHEMRYPKRRINYHELNDANMKSSLHKPELIHRPVHYGEFEVFFECDKEESEEEPPET